MSNSRWATAHGKRFLVETLDYPPKDKARRPTRRFEINWVKLPNYWIEQLERSRRAGTYRLAHRILREAYKRQHFGGAVILSAAVTGLPRTTRRFAIKEMVKLGLIRTKQEGNGAVIVTGLLGGGDKPPRARRGKNGK